MSNISIEEKEILSKATTILESLNVSYDFVVDNSKAAGLYISIKLAESDIEQFVVLYLSKSHGLIDLEFKTLHTGDISSCSVSPREVLRQGLLLNASAIVLGHCHLSGNLTPSDADRRLTDKIVKAAKIFDIKVLDHFIVSGSNYFSFSENGYL